MTIIIVYIVVTPSSSQLEKKISVISHLAIAERSLLSSFAFISFAREKTAEKQHSRILKGFCFVEEKGSPMTIDQNNELKGNAR